MSKFEWVLGFSAEEIVIWYDKTTEDEEKFVIESLLAMSED
jgi:hypothetical protein